MSDSAIKLTVISDTHHYSRTLGDSGRAYELRSGSDQKCLAETGEIIDAAFEKIAGSDADAVLIAGDLSNDGERASHEEFREKLRKLKEKKPVYVITATHDWCCDKRQRRYKGSEVFTDVETIGPDELRDFYREFGPDDSVSEFTTHLGTTSYAVDIGEHLRLLCLNDDQSGSGGAGFSEEHFKWIEAMLSDAKAKGRLVISMEHHLLLTHVHPMISGGGMSVKDEKYVASRLADAGLKYSFVGHSHITDICRFTSEKGNVLTEVNVGSLVGYPAPMAQVTVEPDSVTVDMEYLESFEGQPDAQSFLRNHALGLINNVINGVAFGSKKDFIDRINALNAPGEKAAALRFIIKPAAGVIAKLKVGTAYKVINTLTFGKMINRKDAEPFWDRRVIDIASEVFINLFSPKDTHHDRNSEYYRLVTSVVSVPSKIFRKKALFKNINELVDVLVSGNPLNNFPTKL